MAKLNETTIKNLEAKGFNRWTKNGMDRMYINCKDYGCTFEYYKTGNISDAFFNGVRVSNAEGRRLKGSKVYIDVETGEVNVQTSSSLAEDIRIAVTAMLEDAIAEAAAAEASTEPFEARAESGRTIRFETPMYAAIARGVCDGDLRCQMLKGSDYEGDCWTRDFWLVRITGETAKYAEHLTAAGFAGNGSEWTIRDDADTARWAAAEAIAELAAMDI